ncbi:hypothetical protein FQN54_001991 [Arachnomyces sp. PD_36]|nr:hypothetical protein FQN54_001991 [Arachnomyces sp. PD_36]
MDQQNQQPQTQAQTQGVVPAPAPQGQAQNASLSPLERETRAYQTLYHANVEILRAVVLADWYRHEFELQLVALNENLLQRRAIFDDFNRKSMLWDRGGRDQSEELTENQLERLEANAERYRGIASQNNAAQTYFLHSVVEMRRNRADEDLQRIQEYAGSQLPAELEEQVADYIVSHQIIFHQHQAKTQQDRISWYQSQNEYHQAMINWLEQQPNQQLPLKTGMRDHPLHRRASQIVKPPATPGVVPAPEMNTDVLESGSPTAPQPVGTWLPHGAPEVLSQPPAQITQPPPQMQHSFQRVPEGFGISGAPWTPKDEMWLIINAMYNKSASELANTMPGGRSSTSITRRMADLRMREIIPNNWTLKASRHTNHAWTIEEDIELMRWHASGRETIDISIFHFYDRSGTAALRRAEFLVQDKELERKAKEIEAAQEEALLETDENGDTEMAETQSEEEATQELHRAIVQSLAARSPMKLW